MNLDDEMKALIVRTISNVKPENILIFMNFFNNIDITKIFQDANGDLKLFISFLSWKGIYKYLSEIYGTSHFSTSTKLFISSASAFL